MRVNLFLHNEQFEIQFRNGHSIKQKRNESKVGIIMRAREYALETLLEDEIEIIENDIKKIRRRNTKQLLNQVSKTDGLHLEMIREVLDSRGHGTPNQNAPTVVEIEEETTPEGETTPEKPEPKKNLSKEEIQELTEPYQKDKGKIISFTNRKGEDISAPITGIRYDKRSGMIFYMVRTPTGLFGKTVWSEDFVITTKTE